MDDEKQKKTDHIDPLENESKEEDVEVKIASHKDEKKEDIESRLKEINQSLEVWKEKSNSFEDKYVRLYAELDNMRKRTTNEIFAVRESANENFIIDLLPIVEDFKRALKDYEGNENIDTFKSGIELIYDKFHDVLGKKKLKMIEVKKGDVFDINFHEAVSQLDSGREEKNKVIDILESGYMLGEKVIKYTKVIVGA